MNDVIVNRSGFLRSFVLNSLPEAFATIGLYRDPLGEFTYTYTKDESGEFRDKINADLLDSEGPVSITQVCGEFKSFQIDFILKLLEKKKDKCTVDMIGGPCFYPKKENIGNEANSILEFEEFKAKLYQIVKHPNAHINRAPQRKVVHFIIYNAPPDQEEIADFIYNEMPHDPRDRSQDTILIKRPKHNILCDYLQKYSISLQDTKPIRTQEDIDMIEFFRKDLKKCTRI